ncbi:helicase SNF2 [Thiorhodovibrio winogradskyi]|nr:helicase SNF2 [Thiorhodovibrio winogradskyi]
MEFDELEVTLELALDGDPDAGLDLLRKPAAECDAAIASYTAVEAEALMLSAWVGFLRGQYADAAAGFEAAHAVERKRTRKRNLILPGIVGVLHLLALLERGTPEDLVRAEDLARMVLRMRNAGHLRYLHLLIADLAVLLAGKRRKEDCYALNFGMAPREPMPQLLQMLALHWLGDRLDSKQLSTLSRLAHDAAESGRVWYANEAVALLKATEFDGKLPDFEPPPQDLVTLTELLHPKPHWELALEALSRLKTDQRASKDTEDALRLIWLLVRQGQWVGLEPREQKRTKGCGWTRGRAIPLQRLAEESGKMAHLTAQDRSIAACIVRSDAVGYVSSTQFHLDSERALLAAVGHPLVFRSLDDGEPVELVRGEPTLKVTKGRNDILLNMEPFPEVARHVMPMDEDAQRIRLVEFDERHYQIMSILGAKGLSVPKNCERQVLKSLAAVAPMLTVHSDIGGGADSEAGEAVPADARLHLHLKPIGEGLSLEFFVHPFGDAGGPQLRLGEGSATLFADISGRALRCTRKLSEERAAARELLAHCPALETQDGDNTAWSWQLDDPETALSALEQLQALGDAVVLDWPKGKRIALTPAAGLAQMRARVSSTPDWLELGGALHLDDGRVLELRELLKAMTNSRFVRLGEGDVLTLSEALKKRLDGLRGLTEKGRFHPLAAPAIAELLDGMAMESSPEWEARLARLAELAELEPKIPSTLQAELRDYQIEGYRWLARLAHWGAGACLADDMGLGKTVQALALILSRAPQGPTLVLAPTSVCGNWLEEAARFAPTLKPRRFGLGDRAAMLAQAGPFDLIVASYGLLQTEGERLAEVHWQTIVTDEAQAFKNAVTKRSQAIMQLQGDFRVITTGTPIENHLGELWNLFRFINPGLLGSLESFNARFALPIEQHQDREARARLRALLRPFILRRLKSEVLSELPPRTEITLSIELGDSEKALYEAVRREAIDRIESAQASANPGQQRMQLFAEIMRLRRACCHPRLALPDSPLPSSKLDAFAEIVEELLENRHKALVFSQFVDHLKLIREYLDNRGIRYQYLDGSTPEPKRRAAVTAFQSGEGDLFLISLRAGGSGLNLTAADYVIHMDPWWNPAVEDQASDRAHRIGQQRPVTIYRLVAKDTIEERILALHANKRDLADALLEGTDDSSRLSYAEMLELVRNQ